MLIYVIGIGLVVVTVTIHAFGSIRWIEYLIRRYVDHDGEWRPGTVVGVMLSTAVVLMLLHILEAFVWALAFLALPQTPNLDTLEKATYFSLVTFTTLGYGDITLAERWRLLGGIEAVNGILIAGLSTAMLFAVAQRGWKLRHKKQKQ